MKSIWCLGALMVITLTALAGDKVEGYILKANEGEEVGGPIIKISPKTGSNGAVLINERHTENSSTGTHYHMKADEFFYIVSGRGFVRLDGEEHPVEMGDVIFIPAGTDHALLTDTEHLHTMTFLDEPGLDEEFRAWHSEFGSAWPQSLEQLNAIANEHGTVYRTFFNGTEEISPNH